MDQIYIGNFQKGLNNRVSAFNVDNDAFPMLFNAYVWRGDIKRKRGTLLLDRLRRQVQSAAIPLAYQVASLPLIAGVANLHTLFPEANGTISPGSISVVVGANTYTEPVIPDGTLIGSPAGTGSINYSTGVITINGGGVGPLTGNFAYFPNLPVLGLEDLVSNTSNSNFPLTQSFDSKYSYQVNQAVQPRFYTTNYYKISNVPFTWSNTDDNQFWSTNYQSAFWVTNNKSGLHLVNAAYVSGSPGTTIVFDLTNPAFSPVAGTPYTNLVIGDRLFFNEFPNTTTINSINGTISSISGTPGRYTVTFLTSQTVSGTGIAQLLTNSVVGQDGIKWYDGDPTSGTGIPTGTGLGWVNFAPPLTASQVSINDQDQALYYLVGALAIVPFKDHLCFFGPKIQTSTTAAIQRPLQDTVIWSWNGTPYYNSLVPTNVNGTETFDGRAYYVDQTGFGGYLSAGISKPIVTVLDNEDVLLVGFGGSGKKTRFVSTGNDLQPFLFYLINSEMPSSSTFSGLVFDKGGIDIGNYGITITTQQSCDRIDLEIPDEIFKIQAANNGQNRVNAVRDFFREWIYFTYPTGTGTGQSWVYPSTTLMFNYIDRTWSIFRENFTHQGTFRRLKSYTWSNPPAKTWAQWRQPWSTGSTQALFPSIIAGNPQGYVLIKDQNTGEGISGDIQAIANSSGFTLITSFNHCVNSGSSSNNTNGDYLLFQNALGSTFINNKIGLVTQVIDANNFIVDIPYVTSTYLGLGGYARLAQPLIQTKQFPWYWNIGRQTRLGSQKYLLDKTTNGQITININLSQDSNTTWNAGNILPSIEPLNSSLIYSQILYTCPESENLGLTPANTNLQMPTAKSQAQIWHRLNTSLIGDSVQIGFTLSDKQMRVLEYATGEITLQAISLSVSPASLLS